MVTVRQRSPNYPGVALSQALEDIRSLYAQEKRAPVPPEVAVKAWGYSSLNGNARRRLSAIRQYGLIDQQRNSGDVVLTDRALTLIFRNSASNEYREALKQAALEPTLFAEFYRTREGASNDALKHHLIIERKFTEDGADRFIRVFRDTLRVANLDGSDIISGQEDGYEDYESDEDDDMHPSAQTDDNRVRRPAPREIHHEDRLRYSWPLSDKVRAEIVFSGSEDVSPDDLDLLKEYIDVAKRALARRNSQRETERHGEGEEQESL